MRIYKNLFESDNSRSLSYIIKQTEKCMDELHCKKMMMSEERERTEDAKKSDPNIPSIIIRSTIATATAIVIVIAITIAVAITMCITVSIPIH